MFTRVTELHIYSCTVYNITLFVMYTCILCYIHVFWIIRLIQYLIDIKPVSNQIFFKLIRCLLLYWNIDMSKHSKNLNNFILLLLLLNLLCLNIKTKYLHVYMNTIHVLYIIASLYLMYLYVVFWASGLYYLINMSYIL